MGEELSMAEVEELASSLTSEDMTDGEAAAETDESEG